MEVIIKTYYVAGDLIDGYDFEYEYKRLEDAKARFNEIAGFMFIGTYPVAYVAITEVVDNRTRHTHEENVIARFG